MSTFVSSSFSPHPCSGSQDLSHAKRTQVEGAAGLELAVRSGLLVILLKAYGSWIGNSVLTDNLAWQFVHIRQRKDQWPLFLHSVPLPAQLRRKTGTDSDVLNSSPKSEYVIRKDKESGICDDTLVSGESTRISVWNSTEPSIKHPCQTAISQASAAAWLI